MHLTNPATDSRTWICLMPLYFPLYLDTLSLVFTFSISLLWQNHNLTSTHDFHSYMIRSTEEEFQKIVGVRYGKLSFQMITIVLLLLDGQ